MADDLKLTEGQSMDELADWAKMQQMTIDGSANSRPIEECLPDLATRLTAFCRKPWSKLQLRHPMHNPCSPRSFWHLVGSRSAWGATPTRRPLTIRSSRLMR